MEMENIYLDIPWEKSVLRFRVFFLHYYFKAQFVLPTEDFMCLNEYNK